jgi:hypothetical protein
MRAARVDRTVTVFSQMLSRSSRRRPRDCAHRCGPRRRSATSWSSRSTSSRPARDRAGGGSRPMRDPGLEHARRTSRGGSPAPGAPRPRLIRWQHAWGERRARPGLREPENDWWTGAEARRERDVVLDTVLPLRRPEHAADAQMCPRGRESVPSFKTAVRSDRGNLQIAHLGPPLSKRTANVGRELGVRETHWLSIQPCQSQRRCWRSPTRLTRASRGRPWGAALPIIGPAPGQELGKAAAGGREDVTGGRTAEM